MILYAYKILALVTPLSIDVKRGWGRVYYENGYVCPIFVLKFVVST